MFVVNYVLLVTSLFNTFTRRSIITSGLSHSMIMGNNYKSESNNEYKYYNDMYSKFNYNHKVPFLENENGNDSSEEQKTIIHADDNNIYFQGSVTPESCFYIQQNILKIQKGKFDKINFYLQSSGGSLLPTFGLIDNIQSSNIPIDTYINGFVASAASLISVAGNKRYMSKNSMMLIHSLRTVIGEVNFQELEDNYYNSKSMMNIVKNIYLEKSSLTEDKLDFLLRHDYWLNSTECLKYKLVDEIF